MDFVRLSVFRPVGRKLPGPGLQIDLIPSAACHLFPALTSQRQDFDDVAVGSADLSRSEDDFGKLAIAQHPIPGHLFCRKRHTVGRRTVEDRAANAPAKEGFDRLQCFVGGDRSSALLNCIYDLNHIALADLMNTPATPCRPDLASKHS